MSQSIAPSLDRLIKAVGHVWRAPEVMRCRAEMQEWLPATRAYLGMGGLEMPYTVQFRDGRSLEAKEFSDLEAIWQIWFRRVYEVKPTDRTIVDAGANVGFFSTFAASQSPGCRVWSIEPFPSTYSRLVENVARWGYSDRVSCHNQALAKETSKRLMATTAGDSQSMWLQSEGEQRANSLTVDAIRLEDFLEANRLDQVDLLKMDIEGSEFEVLMTADTPVLRRFGRIEVEYHAPPEERRSKQSLLSRIVDAGFEQTYDTCPDEDFGVAYFSRRG